MLTFSHFLAIGVGAALGAISRWLLGVWLNHAHAALPWGTLAANLGGGYLIGIMLAALSIYPAVPIWLQLMLVTAFLGGLTTFSTFSAHPFDLPARGSSLHALAYSGVSLLGRLAVPARKSGLWGPGVSIRVKSG